MTEHRVAHSTTVDPETGDLADRAICDGCGEPIVWDDWCYVHLNGWADCGATLTKVDDPDGLLALFGLPSPPWHLVEVGPDAGIIILEALR